MAGSKGMCGMDASVGHEGESIQVGEVTQFYNQLVTNKEQTSEQTTTRFRVDEASQMAKAT